MPLPEVPLLFEGEVAELAVDEDESKAWSSNSLRSKSSSSW